jgi:hypothetical protein
MRYPIFWVGAISEKPIRIVAGADISKAGFNQLFPVVSAPPRAVLAGVCGTGRRSL